MIGLAAGDPAVPVLEARGITKSWSGGTVLNQVDLALHRGSVVGVAGGNGTGKTTFLRIFAGMILPESGEVRFQGSDIEAARARYHDALGVLTAGDRGVYARLTVSQNIDFCARLRGASPSSRRAAVEEAMGRLHVQEMRHRRMDRMSMGQRQRVRLAMAFLDQPTVVLLDEPRTSLDEDGVALLAASLDELKARGGAALWVSPEVDEPLVDRPHHLADGHLADLQTTEASNPSATRL